MLSPLQLSVYWRLSLLFFFTPFLFFLDIFAAVIAAESCRHDNATSVPASGLGTFPPSAEINQSERREVFEGEVDWTNTDSVCSWTDWLAYGQTVYMVGLLLGSLVGGDLSDRYGKRRVLQVCALVHALCGLLPALLPHPLLFLTVRGLTAVSCCCINICAFSLAVEWTLPAARLWPPAFLPFCFSLGTMGVAPLAWLSRTWTQLHLALALPQVVCLPLYLFIPESPCWLMTRRRGDALERYRRNSPADKQCLDQLLDSARSDLKAAEAQVQSSVGGGHAPSDITHLRHPTILLRLFIMSFLSAVTALTYYGICLNIGSFGVGVYWAQFFSGLSEAPCLLVPLVPLGRRLISMLALFLSGAACFLSLLLSRYNSEPAFVMGLALLGKLCILAATFISVLYCIELFPTVVRQRCFSLVNLSYRLGCLITTFVPPGPSGAISLAAMVVYSSGPIVGCFLCLLLPETSGVQLPDTVEDCEKQPKQKHLALAALWKTTRGQTKPTELLSTEKTEAPTPNTPFV